MSGTIRLTAAQAMMRWLSVQMTEDGERFIEGVWAIFGHGNVAGVGEALHRIGDALPTWRGQNEQTMAHAAIAYAKTMRRRRAHAVTSSIGPGSTNMVTAAALAHVNRLPVLFICGDVFANRRPDPVLQQIEDFDDGTVSANDAFKPVTRYFDRISRPEHLLTALPRAMRTLTDPADCGPVCLAFCQDVQAEAFDYPESFFEQHVWRIRRPEPDPVEVAEVVAAIRAAKNPVIVAGGGVLYSGAEDLLADFAARRNIPVLETQAGKGATAWDHPMNFGSPGVTGSACGNEACAAADLVIGVGTRFQDFTTGSWTVFANPERRLVSINVHGYDALKHGAIGVVGDARVTLERIDAALGQTRFAAADAKARTDWHAAVGRVTAAPAKETNALPSDAQVIGAVQRVATGSTIAMCAAGTMPGALQVLWQAAKGGYHMEYGYSCMGYEVAGALGIKLAAPDGEVICFVGDGSYMMANSELATAVMRRVPFTVVLTDNRGYGCINRLQQECGGAEFNNMYKDSNVAAQPEIDFVAHAASMGAHAEKAADIAELEAKIAAARGRDLPTVIVIDTDAVPGTDVGGHWWDVAVPQVGGPERLEKARELYHANAVRQRVFNLTPEGNQMPQLLRKPFGAHGKVHEITPASAGWRYVGFSLHRLRPGETAAEATGATEVILVMVEGKAAFTAAGQDWGVLGERVDVFERTPPHCLYVPNGADWRATAETDCTIAVCSAPGTGGHAARRIGPDGIALTERGKGANTRFINNIAMENEDFCDSLLVTEVFTPAGHWSSYPSHRHDEDDFPRITYLEETYYHRLSPKDGFGIQRVYTDDGSLDETMAVSDGDVTLVPRGHHPCGAPYGFEMYYLNVMAGPMRKWRFVPAPAVEWIMKRDA